MNFKADKQAITPDWVEMHFRVADAGQFCTKQQLEHRKFIEEERSKGTTKSDGKALPKFYGQGKENLQLGKTTFKRVSNGNKFYNDLYHIYNRGKKYGVALMNSRDAKLMPLDDIQMQVVNNKLYETGWLDDLKQMTTDLQAKWHNFTRIDIAIDGGNFLNIFDLWHSKKLKKTGRAAVNTYHNNNVETTGFYIGSSKSKKKIKIYNKSKELNKSNKAYIGHFWKLNGLDTSTDVHRLELTIRNEEMKKFKDINWELLDQPAHIASIMRSSMDKFCDFRWNNGQKNITRMEKLELVNWDAFDGKALPKDSTRPTTEIFSAKVTIKKLYEIHLATQQQSWFDHAFEIAINSDLVQWFNKMQKLWSDDLQAKLGANADGLVSDSWVTHFKSYDVNEQIIIFEHDKVNN